MTEMFKSATLKLTAWYGLILIAICLLFSGIIYTIAAGELNTRINYFEQTSRVRYVPGINTNSFDTFRNTQVETAKRNLIGSLVITNLVIWTLGAVGSYYLARRSLRPIEEAHEAQSRFTSDASHELRTPLAIMKTELEVALRDVSISKKDMHELLESNLEEVNKLTRLSHLLLELSKPDHTSIKRQCVSLDDVLARTAKQFDTPHRKIIITSYKMPLFINANIESIEELGAILLDNATKYSPPNSPITIKLYAARGKACFAVVNSGKGIAPAELPHIFDRFYRADHSRTGGTKSGYGLGLSLAKKIVELHYGELSVSSAPDQLTTFFVSLPIFSESKAKIQ